MNKQTQMRIAAEFPMISRIKKDIPFMMIYRKELKDYLGDAESDFSNLSSPKNINAFMNAYEKAMELHKKPKQ